MKHEQWVDFLFATIEKVTTESFAYGKNDCCLFSARVVDAMTGTDYAQKLAEMYHDERSALAYINSFGSIQEAVKDWLGEPTNLAFVQRGDVVLFNNEGRETLGICIGDRIVSVAETGVAYVSMEQAICTWKVK